ncbi:transposase [Streptomyces sp. NPDC052101]|uniref:transposase n=1 Tax=Streptomyces sp. NPDC052101 TaxID=3155763 RepID=UPI00344047DC
MCAVATEMGGRPGQRPCRQMLLHGGRTALLRLLKAPSVPDRAPRILGIDEFAFRKGRTYGAVLVGIETSRPVDVLPHRDTATVAVWLREHPGAEIVCRDRAMMFTKAVRQAAPHAQEVADRRHLLENLSAAVEKTCRQHHDCLRKHATLHGPAQANEPAQIPRTPLLERVRQRAASITRRVSSSPSAHSSVRVGCGRKTRSTPVTSTERPGPPRGRGLLPGGEVGLDPVGVRVPTFAEEVAQLCLSDDVIRRQAEDRKAPPRAAPAPAAASTWAASTTVTAAGDTAAGEGARPTFGRAPWLAEEQNLLGHQDLLNRPLVHL